MGKLALLLLVLNSPAPVVIINSHTGSKLTVTSHLPSPRTLNRFFRCAHDRRYTLMDPRLMLAAVNAARHFGQTRIVIISAFRTRRLNEEMRTKSHKVALRSRHVHGQALDLRILGVDTAVLCEYLRSVHKGGVGCYPRLRFVHVDVGPVRKWDG